MVIRTIIQTLIDRHEKRALKNYKTIDKDFGFVDDELLLYFQSFIHISIQIMNNNQTNHILNI